MNNNEKDWSYLQLSQGFIAFIGSEVPAFSWKPNIWTACIKIKQLIL